MEEPTSIPPQTQWDGYADRLRERLPAAPEGLLSAYVTWAPWIAIVFGALTLLAGLAALGLIGVFLPMGGGYLYGGALFVAGLVAAAAGGLQIVGGYLMRQMKRTGWWLLAIGLIVSVLSNLLSSSLFGIVIALAVAYVHLQVKPRYT
jgi:hypothetical protein